MIHKQLPDFDKRSGFDRSYSIDIFYIMMDEMVQIDTQESMGSFFPGKEWKFHIITCLNRVTHLREIPMVSYIRASMCSNLTWNPKSI